MDREENEKRLVELKVIIREQEGRVDNLRSIAFQLANYYFVFQGVILTAICSGTTSLRCSDRWFLFTVSLLATILNLVALWIIGLKYLRTNIHQDQNWCECNELEKRLQTTINQASGDFMTLSPVYQCHDSCKQLKRFFCFTACMVLFLGFACITLSGCWHIICRKDEFEKQPGNDKCVKICQGASRCIRICSGL